MSVTLSNNPMKSMLLNPLSPTAALLPLPTSGESVARGRVGVRGVMVMVMVDSKLEPIIDRTDGVSVEFPHWRFNLRGSNTEPLLRLNVETRGDLAALHQHQHTIETLIKDAV